MKAEQVMTKAQREKAVELVKKWENKELFGQQPGFVLDKKGNVLKGEPQGYCLAWFFNPYNYRDVKEGDSPILFQVVVHKGRCWQTASNKMQFDSSFVSRYLNWIVNSDMLSPYICKHTKEERSYFVPIALENVPRNAPLLTSTHVRYLWDRHNNSRNINIQVLREKFPRWSWNMVMAVGTCFSNLTRNEVAVGTYDGGHDPFSHVSYVALSQFANKEFDHSRMEKPSFNIHIGEKGSVENMFCKRNETSFQYTLWGAIKKEKGRYGGVMVKGDEVWKSVKTAYKLLKEGPDA